MAIYICLILYLLIVSCLVKFTVKSFDKQEKIILILGIIVIYLIIALKADTVGIDIAGYKAQYNLAKTIDWNNYTYVYFEKGYILLTKFFSKAGFSFEAFNAIIYAFITFSWFLFIKKYSKNVTLSLLIYICYQFFVFNLSGIRQSIAIAICIFSYIIFEKKNKKNIVLAIMLVVIAISIHKSSAVFYFVLLISLIKGGKINFLNYFAIYAGALIFRNTIWQFIKKYFNEVDVNTSITLGGNFIFLILVAILSYFAIYYAKSRGSYDTLYKKSKNGDLHKLLILDNDVIFLRILLMSIACNIVFSGSSMLRAAMYLTIFIIPLLPNVIKRVDEKSKIILNIIIGLFMILLFYFETLTPNQFNIIPYSFFWN